VVPLVLAIIALGIYPQLVVHRTEDATVPQIREAAQLDHPREARAGRAGDHP
jgi:hypothetical protein